MEMVLGLVKARLNRPPGDTALDAYFKKRIEGAAAKLKRTGIHLTESADDMMLLVDYTVWQYPVSYTHLEPTRLTEASRMPSSA